jgi:hypothetical protein
MNAGTRPPAASLIGARPLAARGHALVAAGARALGIDAGPVKGDPLWTADGLVLLEVAPRFPRRRHDGEHAAVRLRRQPAPGCSGRRRA